MKTKFYLLTCWTALLLTAFVSISEAQRWRGPRPVITSISPSNPTLGDTLSLRIRASVSDTFTVNIYQDTILVNSLTAFGGTTVLPSLGLGRYWYEVQNAIGDVVARGSFSVRGPRVDARISPSVSTVGDSVFIRIDAPATESFTLTISQDSTVVQTLSVNGDMTLLPSLQVGHYRYELTNADGYTVARGSFAVKAPRVHARVTPSSSTVGDTVAIFIDAPATEVFTLAISENGTVVQTLTVNGGATDLPSLAVGHYTYELTNAAGYVVARGSFAVRAPHVNSRVSPSRSIVGDTVTIYVDAPASESFTLTISQDSTIVQTLTVNGGATDLPLLDVGHYRYGLTDAAGYIVARGSFSVHPPRVVAFVHPHFAKEGDSLTITVLAQATQSFIMNIYEDSTLIHTLTVTGGVNALPMLGAGSYKYELISADGYIVAKGGIKVFVPQVDTNIFPNPSNPGEGAIVVDADVTEIFTLNIYDASTVVASQPITGGTNVLPVLTSGVYYYQVLNADGDRVSRGRIIIYQ